MDPSIVQNQVSKNLNILWSKNKCFLQITFWELYIVFQRYNNFLKTVLENIYKYKWIGESILVEKFKKYLNVSKEINLKYEI